MFVEYYILYKKRKVYIFYNINNYMNKQQQIISNKILKGIKSKIVNTYGLHSNFISKNLMNEIIINRCNEIKISMFKRETTFKAFIEQYKGHKHFSYINNKLFINDYIVSEIWILGKALYDQSKQTIDIENHINGKLSLIKTTIHKEIDRLFLEFKGKLIEDIEEYISELEKQRFEKQ